MSQVYLRSLAWREILARVFEGQRSQTNVSPEWLVNPATRRRLKLDYLYPELGVAVRFAGLTAKGQRRQSDWEVLEAEQRDQTRAELCRLNGVQLAIIQPLKDPVEELDGLLRVLSRASRLAAQEKGSPAHKRARMDGLGKAHRVATDLRGRIRRRPDQMMATLAERWRDREEGLVSELQRDRARENNRKRKAGVKKLKALRPGQRVQHSAFGPGVVTGVQGEGEEMRVSILFDASQERTFLANLVADKLRLE